VPLVEQPKLKTQNKSSQRDKLNFLKQRAKMNLSKPAYKDEPKHPSFLQEERERKLRQYDSVCVDEEENDHSMFDATQHGDATQLGVEGANSHFMTAPPANPDVDVWGVVRRRGGNQEEFKMLHRLKDGKRDTYVLGRNMESCDITAAHKSVSSTHCRIYCDYTQARLRVFLEDSSVNGTFVNDSLTRLTRGERMELKSGDEIFLINPRLLQSKRSDSHADHNAVGSTSFTFVNIRERVAATREKSRAPSSTQQAPCARHVEDVYVIGDQIGSGMCGTVHLCIERASGLHCAVKIIDTKKFALSPGLTPADLREEAAMMMTLDHPNIIRIKDTFETDNIIFIVMELVRGGDLFDRIVEKGKYKEDEARLVMQKVLSAVKYLHSKDIIHRDLKPENILLMEPNNDTEVKITDFGLAKRTNQEGLKTFCGTPQYFAPEVLKRKNTVKGLGSYGTAADIWSLGVVLFILLSGAFPFDDDNLLVQIQNAQYSLSGAEWTNISDTAKHLVRSMMTLRPDQRLTVDQALDHPWMKNEPFPEKTRSFMQFVNQGVPRGPGDLSSTSSSTAHVIPEHTRGGKKGTYVVTGGPKRKYAGKDTSKSSAKTTSNGINRKQTSGSQGILQLLAASSSKEKLKTHPDSGEGSGNVEKSFGSGSVESLAVAAAYTSYSMRGPAPAAMAPLEALPVPLSAASDAPSSAAADTTITAPVNDEGKSLYSMMQAMRGNSSNNDLITADIGVFSMQGSSASPVACCATKAIRDAISQSPIIPQKVTSKRAQSPSISYTSLEVSNKISRTNEETCSIEKCSEKLFLPKTVSVCPGAHGLLSDMIDNFSDDAVCVGAPEQLTGGPTGAAPLPGNDTLTLGAISGKLSKSSNTKVLQTKKKSVAKAQQPRITAHPEQGRGSLESAWKRVPSTALIGPDENIANEGGKGMPISSKPARKLRIAPKTIADLFSKQQQTREHAAVSSRQERTEFDSVDGV